MNATALRKEAYQAIDLLPDDALKAVVDLLGWVNAVRSQSAVDAGSVKPGAVDRSILGVFPGEVEISEDFFETPEGFEEYL